MPPIYQQILTTSRNNVAKKLSFVTQQELPKKDTLWTACLRKKKPDVPHTNLLYGRKSFWQVIRRWRDVTEEQFLSYEWQVGNSIFVQIGVRGLH